jgi:hypothetical protein
MRLLRVLVFVAVVAAGYLAAFGFVEALHLWPWTAVPMVVAFLFGVRKWQP